MSEGQKAAAISPLVTEFVVSQQAAIVSRLTSQYNSGRLTPEAALAGVGELAAVDRLLETVESTIARQQRAEAREFKRVTGTG